jgi:hypothetical protein
VFSRRGIVAAHRACRLSTRSLICIFAPTPTSSRAKKRQVQTRRELLQKDLFIFGKHAAVVCALSTPRTAIVLFSIVELSPALAACLSRAPCPCAGSRGEATMLGDDLARVRHSSFCVLVVFAARCVGTSKRRTATEPAWLSFPLRPPHDAEQARMHSNNSAVQPIWPRSRL